MRSSTQIFSYALYLFTAFVAVAAVAVFFKFIREQSELRARQEKRYACMLDAMKKVPGIHDAEMDYVRIKGVPHPIFKYNYPNPKGVLSEQRHPQFDIEIDGFLQKALDEFQGHGQPAKHFDMEIDGFVDEAKPTQVKTWLAMNGIVSKKDNLPYYWGTGEVDDAWTTRCGVSLFVLSV